MAHNIHRQLETILQKQVSVKPYFPKIGSLEQAAYHMDNTVQLFSKLNK